MTEIPKTDIPIELTTTGNGLHTLEGLADALAAGERLAGVAPRVTFIEDPDRANGTGARIPIALVEDSNGSKVEVLGAVIAQFEARAPGPRRRTGETVLTEEASFAAHVKRWSSEDTVIYADTAALAFVAVIDEHPAGPDHANTAWRGHRARYACPRSAEWIAWTALDGAKLSQVQLADFLESRLEDLASGAADDPRGTFPRPIDMIQVARNLSIKTKGTFERSFNPTTGDHIMISKSETEPGSTAIPRAFLIAIPVFDGGVRYQIEARIRFGTPDGIPQFSFTLHRRAEIERDAFTGVRERVASETGRIVLAGKP